MLHAQKLHSNWTLRASGDLSNIPEPVREKTIPATVPGCVHTDLMSANLLDDPYVDRNELEQMWIGKTDWEYRCTFTADAELHQRDRVDLVCEGLDTVAAVMLNGETIGRSESQHITYRFDAAQALREGENELVIEFRSPVHYAREMQDKLGDRPHTCYEPFNFIRKAACNFGWDWGPKVATSGIWKPIRLEAWDNIRIDAVRPLVTRADSQVATVEVHVDVERFGESESPVHVELSRNGTCIASGEAKITGDAKSAVATLDVNNPDLWWPRGYGDQPLYDLRVTLGESDSWTRRIGLRTSRLNTEPDEIGSKFIIEVNGKPVFCKGANWIPDDCFFARVSEADYRQRIGQACDANLNMLRIWGGGIFETEPFYEICDELGIMVWQDFLFACALYPEEEPFGSLVEREARDNVARLSSHASLVIWNGNNENFMGLWGWGYGEKDISWMEYSKKLPWGGGFYFDVLPEVIRELDPTKPYWPGSPYSGSEEIEPNSEEHGNMHIWNPYSNLDYTCYRDDKPRFSSEFGFQGPMTFATLSEAVPADQWKPGSEGMKHRQRAPVGDAANERQLLRRFEMPEKFEDWIYLLQVNQARAVTLGVEWFRSLKPRCMGTLYWQWNDCWPVLSWAAIDSSGRPKPLYYATRRFFAPRLVTIQPTGPETGAPLQLIADNDSDSSWKQTLILRRMSLAGDILAEREVPCNIAPRTRETLATLDDAEMKPQDPTKEFLFAAPVNTAVCDATRATYFFAPDKELQYPAPQIDWGLHRLADGKYELKLTAESFVRDLCIFADIVNPDAECSDQLLTMLPGETASIEIESQEDLELQQLTAQPVLQCANFYSARG